MKVKIIDNQGVHTEIDARNIEVDGKTLSSILRDFRNEVAEFRKFKQEYLKKEKELKEAWKKLR